MGYHKMLIFHNVLIMYLMLYEKLFRFSRSTKKQRLFHSSLPCLVQTPAIMCLKSVRFPVVMRKSKYVVSLHEGAFFSVWRYESLLLSSRNDTLPNVRVACKHFPGRISVFSSRFSAVLFLHLHTAQVIDNS